jgi:hypothetical protein
MLGMAGPDNNDATNITLADLNCDGNTDALFRSAVAIGNDLTSRSLDSNTTSLAIASAPDSPGGELCSPKPRLGFAPAWASLPLGLRPHLRACKRSGFARRRAVLAETPVWASPPTSRLARRSDSAPSRRAQARLEPRAWASPPPARLQALRIRPAASGARRNPGLGFAPPPARLQALRIQRAQSSALRNPRFIPARLEGSIYASQLAKKTPCFFGTSSANLIPLLRLLLALRRCSAKR